MSENTKNFCRYLDTELPIKNSHNATMQYMNMDSDPFNCVHCHF